MTDQELYDRILETREHFKRANAMEGERIIVGTVQAFHAFIGASLHQQLVNRNPQMAAMLEAEFDKENENARS